MSEIRSQRAASFMKWVEMKIVTPWSRQLGEQRTEFIACQRIDAGGRLVENEQVGIV